MHQAEVLEELTDPVIKSSIENQVVIHRAGVLTCKLLGLDEKVSAS